MFVNVGNQERKVRIVAGIACMAIGFAAPIPDLWHIISNSAGVALLFTASLGFCPLKGLVMPKARAAS